MVTQAAKLIMLMFSLTLVGAGSVNGADVAKIYKLCKPLADRAFEFKTTEDVACNAYIQGVLDTAGQLCFYGNSEEYRNRFAEVDTLSLAALDHFLVSFLPHGSEENSSHDATHAVIQNFVNTAKEAPESWGLIASASILDAAMEIKPCKSKN